MISTRDLKLIFFIIFCPLFLFAQQGTIETIVIDEETNDPIIGASASLLQQSNQSYIQGAQSDVQGKLVFSDVDFGTYAIRITYVGKENVLIENVRVTNQQPIKLAQVSMMDDGTLIEEVVVEGRVPEMSLGIDKKVFDVSQSLVSVGGSASDLLQNVPTLDVDADGNVSLRGSSSVKILIDGRESAMAGSDINALLQSLPANSIEKVELITNPSAKYDAEGQSGIINIILKKNVRTGLNGSVTASGGSYDNYSGGVDLNYRDRNFNFFGGYNYANRVRPGNGFNDNTELIDGIIRENSERTISTTDNNRKGKNHTFRFGTDWYAAPKTTFSLGANVSVRDNDRRSDIDYRYFNIPDLGESASRVSQQYEEDLGVDITFDFKQELKREGEEITANITYGNDTEDGTNDFYQTYANGRAPFERQNVTSEAGKNWNFQLDYVLPFAQDHKFEAGYRTIVRNSEDSQWSEILDTVTNQFMPDYGVSNDFDLTNSVHALYVNYQRKLTEKLGVQVGLRGEQTYLQSTYYNLDPNAPEDEKTNDGNQDFFRLYPSAFLSYEVGNSDDKVQLSYTRRVQRPRGWQVNPFVNINDEINYRQGNPNLLPEDIHSFELSFAKFYDKWNFISSAYYRRSSDMMSPFLRDPEEIADIVGDRSNVTYSRWENVSKQDAMGLELISKVNFLRWWDATANVNLFYDKTMPYAEFNTGDVENFSWNGNINTNVKFTKSTTLQARGFYRAPRKWIQGRMKSMAGLDVAVRQDVLAGKGSVMFNVRDVFNSQRFRMENNLPTQFIQMENRWMRRMFSLSFTYRFGIQDLTKKKEDRGAGDNGMDEGMEGGF
ncbi:outer membrane beta-barrel family protein [Sphingobacterium corticibacterium]|uniref:TonB-dependent receptor n=1 Tax=Sphingobacterium corticibacterium TaxID=2484746 RepID=A0A4Q6XT35_9SPHI|nr:outer membrane beta-barrel family protein [Sphingobacterium corticibacterium]RZF59466.1 TonB-dependent receptor [Sphingobacterium corticibacterium]